MDAKRLDEIEQRAAKATDGPWQCVTLLGKAIAVLGRYTGDWWIDTAQHIETKNPADAVFIAAARSDVPDLVAEVRRLVEEMREIVRCGHTEACRALMAHARRRCSCHVEIAEEAIARYGVKP